MANLNDFLTQLGIGKTQYPDSPSDPAAPDAAPINQVTAEPADDDSDSSPTLPKGANPKLMSQADINAIQSIPLPQRNPATNATSAQEKSLEDEISSAAADSGVTDQPSAVATPDTKLTRYQDLMNRLKAAQGKSQDDLGRINTGEVFAQIGQALAAKGGGKAPDTSTTFKSMRDAALNPVNNIKDQIAELPKAVEGQRLVDASDKDSDISNFARTQAINTMAKMAGKSGDDAYKAQLNEQFKGMSALDLEKLGFKGMGTPTHAFAKEDRFLVNGHPASFDPNTNTYTDAITGKVAGPNDIITSSVARKDALDDTYKFMPSNGPLMGGPARTTVAPTGQSTGASTIIPGASSDNNSTAAVTPVAKEYTLNDLNQAQIKNYDKIVTPALKGVRENPTIDSLNKINTAANTMLEKLTPDPKTGKVDSGNLQAAIGQYATMASGGPATDALMSHIQGAGGIINQGKRIVGKAIGEMTPEDIDFLKQSAYKFQEAAQQAAKDATQPYVDQIKAAYPNLPLQDDNVRKILGIQNQMRNTMVENSKAASNNTSGLVTVQGPSGQTVQMSKDNAQKYLSKPGYKLVQ